MENIQILTAEKFAEIYTNKDFRNNVAHAHGCYDARYQFKHFKTCSYPIAYIVSEEQISEAKALKQLQKTETLNKYNSKEYENILVFISMGMDFDKKDKNIDLNLKCSDIENYRIRCNFLVGGQKYFVEFSTCRHYKLHCDFSIKYTGKDEYYNFGNIHGVTNLPYTKESILKIVNRTFNSKFKSIEIDRFDISPDDYVSRSI